MNTLRGPIAAGALLLLVFSTPVPAPQVPGSAHTLPVPQSPDALVDLVTLSEAQTAALKALKEKLASIDKRVLKLEKEKNDG